MQKPHAVIDAVKRKNSTCVVQIDADPGRRRSREFSALVVVHEGVLGVRAVQTPGLVVPAQAAVVRISFAADSPVGDGHVDLCPPPVHLPVPASPRQALPAQHLEEKENK